MQGELNLGDNWASRPRRPNSPERLFFGIMPKVDVQGVVDAYRTDIINEFQLTHNGLIGAERYHISLHALGDFKRLPPPKIFAAKRAGDAVSIPPFEVTFPFFKSFETKGGRQQPLVLIGEGDGLTRLYTVLGACLIRNGLPVKLGEFTPHLTLLYSPKFVLEQPIEPIRFTVREFALIHSKRGLSEYDVLERWPLH